MRWVMLAVCLLAYAGIVLIEAAGSKTPTTILWIVGIIALAGFAVCDYLYRILDAVVHIASRDNRED